MNLPEITLDEIMCSYCQIEHTRQRDEFNEACCDRCFDDHVQTSAEIRAHEQGLADEGYYGYPDAVTTPEISRIEVGQIIKQRGNEFKVTGKKLIGAE